MPIASGSDAFPPPKADPAPHRCVASAVVPALLPRPSMSHVGRLVLVPLLLVLTASSGRGATLLRPDGPPRPGALPSERSLVVDGGTLAGLRTKTSAAIDAFPLGGDGDVSLDLVRFDPFAGTRAVEVTADGEHGVPLPARSYFRGTVRGDASSLVLLVAGADDVRGFVVHAGMTYPFGRDASGVHRVYALRDVDPAKHPGPREFCGNDLHPDAILAGPAPKAFTSGLPQPPIGPSTILEVEAAIETDNELKAKFGNSTPATLAYLTDLLAAANVIYERDLKVRLKFTYVRIWATPDPWSSSDTIGQLTELGNYWNNPANHMNSLAGAHDVVHLISGKGNPDGGVAYLNAACVPTLDYGVSQVIGGFDVDDPDGIWDVLVVTHEIGHNLGSVHTHCYDPPVDHCFNGEGGCWSGAESLPPGGGTIMSYCHLLAPGLSNVNLLFGATVSATIRSFVTSGSASCLSVATSCGDGTKDAGEQCDDGNFISGDGCSAACLLEGDCGDGNVGAGEECDDGNATSGDGCSSTCQLETVCGNGAVEGAEQCDDGNTSNGDGCSSQCVLETVCGDGQTEGIEQCDDGNVAGGDGCSAICRFEVCGNHYVDVGEQCDDGNTVSGDGCSDTCVHEPLCGDGTLDPGEECDDHNKKSGDGCSAGCLREPCQILSAYQTTWGPARVVATPSTFSLKAHFGVPSDVVHLDTIAATGVHVLVDGATGARSVDATIPGGAGWTLKGSRLRYRDRAGAMYGVRSIVLHMKNEAVTTIDIKLASHGGPVPNVDDAPPTVTVLLGDATAGDVGACGRYAFNGGACVKRGKRLTCR
jgi:cysteine-rich repeat protein